MTTSTSSAALARHHDVGGIAAAYDSPSWWYDVRGFLILTFSYRATLWNQMAFFGTHMEGDHLEVAIGSGTLFDMCLGWRKRRKMAAVRATGIDYAERMLDGAHARFDKRDDVNVELASVYALPYEDASFDTINIANAMHCFSDVDRALGEIHRVLRPGKSVAMNVLLEPKGLWPWRTIAARINAWGQRRKILHRAYEQDEIVAHVEAAGLTIERIERRGNVCNLVARKA